MMIKHKNPRVSPKMLIAEKMMFLVKYRKAVFKWMKNIFVYLKWSAFLFQELFQSIKNDEISSKWGIAMALIVR